MKMEKIAEPLLALAAKTAQFINGRFEQGQGEDFSVLNPSDGSVYAELKGVSLEQTERAIDAAHASYQSGVWARKTNQERVAILRDFVNALRDQTPELEAVSVAEAGCPVGPETLTMTSGVMSGQVKNPVHQADGALDLYLKMPEFEENPLPILDRVNPMGGLMQSIRNYSPVGVVAAIAAYNFPLHTAMWKVLPALATGNSVILRPNPFTPISALGFARAAEKAGLPAGVMNVIMEGSLEGAKLLTTHLKVDMVAFTGSSAVGKQVMRQVSETMKRLQMELGGKSAAIYLPDAMEQAKNAAMMVCGSHAGQGCTLGTRIFVPEERKAELMAAMKANLEALKIGPADDPTTILGPLISEAQIQRCEHFVKLAVEDGAKVVTGGKRPSHLTKGFYFEPTILDTPDNKNAAAQEEIFGPVVSVIGYRDIEHAIEMANDSNYGLSGYVFSQDRRKALEVAMRIRSGIVCVNGMVVSAYNSSGGQRLSGYLRERGIEGFRAFQEMTALNIN